MFVIPAKGLKVRDWRTKRFISEDGAEVPDNDLYWLQRVSQGDVTKGEPPKEKTIERAKTAPETHIMTGEGHNSAPSEEKAQ